MKKYLTLWFALLLNGAIAQKMPRPYKCGFYDRDTIQLRKTFETNLIYWDVQKGETVASIGAQNGNLEVRLAAFIDSVDWTLQDIDSSCFNKIEFDKAFNYYEKLSAKKITGTFNLVLGTEINTNLKANNYDRVLLISVYHELKKKQPMLQEIYKILKLDGKLVIMEKMGKRKGKKRKDCNHTMPYEPNFLRELNEQQFEMVSKKQIHNQTYYIFKKQRL